MGSCLGNREEPQKERPITPMDPERKLLQTLGWKKELVSLHRHKAKYQMNEDSSVTIWPAPDCQMSKDLLKTTSITELMLGVAQRAKCGEIEATSNTNLTVVGSTSNRDNPICSFINASLDAWANHYPIRFKPEHIWLLVLQGVAVHVDLNAEQLRTKYVNHDGKMKLVVRRDDFILGSDKNDWEGVIEEFVEQIDANTVKDTAQLFDCDFSGSTKMEKVCTKVTIMDICKNYFVYEVRTLCGFPQITLDGNREDWIRLKEKTSVLLKDKVDEQFGSEWAEALIPLLDRFIGAFDGEIDCLFWNSMIKRGAKAGSGAYDYFTGWINILFPFTNKRERNRYCVPYSMDKEYVKQGFTLNDRSGDLMVGHGGDGTKTSEYPTGLAQAPVTWKYHGNELELQFIAGFVGYQQESETLEICPNLGWCIAHRGH